MTPGRCANIVALATLALLSSCAPQPPEHEKPAGPPAEFPQAYYEQAMARGEPVFRIDPKQSVVVIEVRRGGSLARLGHDHVIAAHNLAGFVAPDAARADLYVALDDLSVDELRLRQAAGFETQPSESDIAGTRTNMLDKVLETQRFPHALIRVNGGAGKLAVVVTLHGVTRELEVPGAIRIDRRSMDATGRLTLNQTDFGITPYSIMGGAIQVQDRLELRFEIRAMRELPG
jgi:hypothetical protein